MKISVNDKKSSKSFENINKCYTFVKSPCRAMGV